MDICLFLKQSIHVHLLFGQAMSFIMIIESETKLPNGTIKQHYADLIAMEDVRHCHPAQGNEAIRVPACLIFLYVKRCKPGPPPFVFGIRGILLAPTN